MSSSSRLLPPLNISQLNKVPVWESSAEHFRRSEIEFVLRHVSSEKISEKEIKQWSICIYRIEEKPKESLDELAFIDNSSSDDEDNIPAKKSNEYLIFLFQKALGENKEVFVLSTSKAYKHIRNDCSMQFPRNCSRSLSSLFARVQQVAIGQVFGPVSESSMILNGSLSETVNQNGLICREYTAVGEGLKVKFKENGILIYRSFSLEQYADIVDSLSKQQIDFPIFEWDIPEIPSGNLTKVNDAIQQQLQMSTCRYLAGKETPADWTFSFRVSERQYSNATAFRLCTERRRYGSMAGGAIECDYYNFPTGPLPPDIEHIRECLPSSYLGAFIEDFIVRRQVSIEYQTTQEEWYRQTLIDCIEGWLRTNEGNVYFKLGTLWFQIQQDYVRVVQEAFGRVIGTSGCLLTQGQSGYLHLPWGKQVGETETVYNRSYLTLNAPSPAPPIWFDGNQKFRSNVELFDIFHIGEENRAYIYHVKKSFNTHMRAAVSQLITSAQLIYNSRNTTNNHPDALETLRYCNRVLPNTNANGNNQIFQALRTRELYFVLAFRPDGDLSNSASLIAKREVIRAKEEIEKLGFVFRISQIPGDLT